MKAIKSMLIASGLALVCGGAMAENTGVERMGNGTVEAVTSPGKIVEGVSEETAKNGPVSGAVVGTAKGTVDAAGAAVHGGASVGVGAVETGAGVVKKVLEPLTGQ